MFHVFPDDWPRREHFQHYINHARCAYSLTVAIDITELRRLLKARNLREYPAQIYLLATAVNEFPEFRTGFSQKKEPGYWDVLTPSYTILNPDTKTFSNLWTDYQKSFSAFYSDCLEDIHRYANATTMFPKERRPDNTFDISSVPWIDFTAFHLNLYSGDTYLRPIFTIGKYRQEGGQTLMPLAIQIHHAACDGYHVGQFVQRIREMAQKPEDWLLK